MEGNEDPQTKEPPSINKKAFDLEERESVAAEELFDAMGQELLAEQPEGQHSENRTPTKKELQERYRLQRLVKGTGDAKQGHNSGQEAKEGQEYDEAHALGNRGCNGEEAIL